MGETGCGKTALVEFMCAVLGVRLVSFDVHGGYTQATIEEKMNEVKRIAEVELPERRAEEIATLIAEKEFDKAEKVPLKSVWVFFDEINTCNYLGVFNEMLCTLSSCSSSLCICRPWKSKKTVYNALYREGVTC